MDLQERTAFLDKEYVTTRILCYRCCGMFLLTNHCRFSRETEETTVQRD